MWKAEEANATRIAVRANFVLTGITALIGLKIFILGKEFHNLWVLWCHWQVKALAVFGLFTFAALIWALFIVMGIRLARAAGASGGKTSSCLLNLGDQYNSLFSADDEDVIKILHAKTYAAALNLQNRNLLRQKGVKRAEVLLVCAFLGMSACLGFYACLMCHP